MTPPETMLNTNQLALRPCTLNDIAALHALWTDPGVRKYLWDDQIIPIDTARDVVEASIVAFKSAGYGQWVVVEAGHDAIIGFCGLRAIDEGPDVEILYGFYPAHWGKGYAVEAAQAVMAYGFSSCRLKQIIADTDPPNTASARVMQKLGMTPQPNLIRHGLPTIRYTLNKTIFKTHPTEQTRSVSKGAIRYDPRNPQRKQGST